MAKWLIVVALSSVAIAAGCKKAEDPPRPRTKGAAETVPKELEAAEKTASRNRSSRAAWMNRVFDLSTCFWRVRDVKRADAFFVAALSNRSNPGRGGPIAPRHKMVPCVPAVRRVTAEHAPRFNRLVDIAEKLTVLTERLDSYLRERDYLEDNFVSLEKLRETWTVELKDLEREEAYTRGVLRASRLKLREALAPDLEDKNARAYAYELMLTSLDSEELLATAPTTLTSDLKVAIDRLSEVREALRASPERPPDAVFTALSKVVGALKQIRRDQSAERANIDLRDRERPVGEFYEGVLRLGRAVAKL